MNNIHTQIIATFSVIIIHMNGTLLTWDQSASQIVYIHLRRRLVPKINKISTFNELQYGCIFFLYLATNITKCCPGIRWDQSGTYVPILLEQDLVNEKSYD